MSDALFQTVGGRKEIAYASDGSEHDVWNFGVEPAPVEFVQLMQGKQSFNDRFPALAGRWDGTTIINHWNCAKAVLGDSVEDLIQQQPRGTCGGRAGSASCDFVQAIMIKAGKRAKFKRVSHASLYYFARKLYNMLTGRWNDDRRDGVASGSIPEAMVKFGLNSREEAGDTKYYGTGSDDLACQLGAGMLTDLATKLEGLARDNIITEWTPIKSAQEAADAIASNGIVIGSDSQGFSMNRDSDGFCSPRGTWYHYHLRISVGSYNGRKGFGYFQSWGKSNPSGPLLPGHPGNCFGVDFEVQDRCIKNGGDYAAIFGFDPFELEQGKVNVDWSLQ